MKNYFWRNLIYGLLLLALTLAVGLWLGGFRESAYSQKKNSAPVTALEDASATDTDRNADPLPPAAPAAAPNVSVPKVAGPKLPEATYAPSDPELGVSALQLQLQRAVEISRAGVVINPDGSATRVRLMRDDTFKYPLLRVSETFSLRGGSSDRFDPRPAKTTIAVADHVMVNPTRKLSAEEATTLATELGGTVRQQSALTGVLLLALPDATLDSLPAAEAALANHPLVKAAEPDFVVHALGTAPNDPSFAQVYSLNNTGQAINGVTGTADADMDVLEAWDATTGSATVQIGVIDTGVDWQHSDLVGQIATNPGEIPGNGIDDDNNGFIDDVRGWDFYARDNNPMDENSHGTHVSGTIGARTDNGIGIAGVMQKVAILPLRFLGPSGSGSASDAMDCMAYATLRGCKITNNSWGGGDFTSTFEDQLEAARLAGSLFVAAAGNDGSSNLMFPAAYSSANILSVAATDNQDSLAGFSNYDNGTGWVDVAAPGVRIYSTIPNNDYAYFNGTSMATPNASGVAGLIRSIIPELTPEQIITWIKASVDQKSGLTGKVTSGGRVNAARAIIENLSIPWPTITSSEIADSGNANGVINPGESVTLTVNLRNVSSVAASGLSAVLSLAEANPYVTLTGTTANPGSLAFAETKPLVFTFSVAANAPTPQPIKLNVTTTDSAARTRVLPLTLTAYTQVPVTGTVRDMLGAPLAGATVSYNGLFQGTVTTAGDGSYTLTLVDGAHELTATKATYTPTGPRVVTTPPAQNGIDFVLSRPNIIPGEISLTATIGTDNRTTLQLPLSNDGTAPVAYTVRRMSYDYAKNGDPNGVPYSWYDISTTGTSVSTAELAPDGRDPFISGPFSIGMDFPLYENTFTRWYMNSIGWLSLSRSTPNAYDYPSELPNDKRPGDIIAVQWVQNWDWYQPTYRNYPAGSRKMFYQQVDPQTFVITQQRWAAGDEDLLTSQIVLKRDGTILLQYNAFSGWDGTMGTSYYGSPRVYIAGIQDSLGQRGVTPVYGPTRIMPNPGTAIRMYPSVLAPWVTPSQFAGSIPANGGQTTLPVTFDATGLAPGSYTTKLVLDSNDPDQPALEIPLTLTVTAELPAIVWVGPAAEANAPVGSTLVLEAHITGSLTGLTAVNFYNGETLLGTGTLIGDNYTFNWINVPAGEHKLRAEAVFGSASISTPERITTGGSGFRVSIDAIDYTTNTPAISSNLASVEPFGITPLDFRTGEFTLYDRRITSITRSGTTATIRMPEFSTFNFGLDATDTAVISGATQSQYNGTKAITWVSGQDTRLFTFPVSGSPATPATGTPVVNDLGRILIEEQGRTLNLKGEIYRKFPLNYTVTPSTVLEFEFLGRSLSGGDPNVIGIGFDTDNTLSKNRIFQVWGGKPSYGAITTYNTYNERYWEPPATRWQHYRIPVGQHFTGAQNFLIFLSADTSYNSSARYNIDVAYRNIRLYEDPNATTDYNFTWSLSDTSATPTGRDLLYAFKSPGTKTVSVTATRGGYTATASRNVDVTGSSSYSARIDFQPAGIPIVPGYLPDTGAVYADRGNGETYGWVGSANTSAKEDALTSFATYAQQTIIRQTTSQVWEIAVPNGVYNVYVMAGGISGEPDPTANNLIRAEGVTVIDRNTGNLTFTDGSARTTVADGKLTLTSGRNSASLCYAIITRVNAAAAAPMASFTASTLSGEAPVPVSFDAAASYANVGSIASYAWNFGDGTSATGVNPSHTFTSPGLRTVTLTVTDSGGATATAATAIAVTGVPQVASSIVLTPESASVSTGGARSFSAVVLDQFDLPLAPQPAISWSVSGGGSISGIGVFTAGALVGGPFTVTAISGALSADAAVTVVDPVPTSVSVSPASASLVINTTQLFFATVFDQFGQPMNPQPAITWETSGGGTISSGGLFTAGGAAGGPFTVIASSGGVSNTAEVSITSIPPVASSIVVTPANSIVAYNATRQFSAVVSDQFGQLLDPQPTVTWSINGGGVIDSNGMLTAGVNPGSFTVTATAASLSGTSGFAVAAVPSTSVFSAHFNNGTGSGVDDDASLYKWAVAIGTGGQVANSPATVAGVSQGVTDTAGVPLATGQSKTGGFLFALPTSGTPGAMLLHRTDLAAADTLQDNPQIDWHRSGPDSLTGLTVIQIEELAVYTRPAKTTTVMRFAIRVDDQWFASATSFTQSNLNVYERRSVKPSAINWISGVFTPGTSLDDDLSNNPSAPLPVNGVISGYGWYADTGTLTATDSRVRIDSYVIHANVESAPPLTGYDAWKTNAFPEGAAAGERAPEFDFDHDGLSNLLEYGLGTDPSVPGTAPVAQIIEDAGNQYLQIQWTRPDDRTDITTMGEISPDLAPGSWSSVPAEVSTTITAAGPGEEIVIIRDLSPIGAQSRRFLRARITLP